MAPTRPPSTRACQSARPTQRAIFSWSSHKKALGCPSCCWYLVLHGAILNLHLLYTLTSLFHNILSFWDPSRRLIDMSHELNNTKLTHTYSSTTSHYFNPVPEQETSGVFSFLLNYSDPPTSRRCQALSVQIPKALLLSLFSSTSSVITFCPLLPKLL